MKRNSPYIYYGAGGIAFLIIIALFFFRNPPSLIESEKFTPTAPSRQQFRSPSTPSKENVNQNYLKQVDALRRSVVLHPKNTTHLTMLARLLTDGHKIQEAIPYFERALQLQPNNDSLLIDLSVCYFSLRRYRRAMELTDRILVRTPSNLVALYNKGAIDATLGKKKEAKKSWNKLIEVAPKSEEATKAKTGLTQLEK